MRKSLIITAMAAMAISVSAAKVKKTVVPTELMPTWTEWHDLQVNEVNRYGLHTNFFAPQISIRPITTTRLGRQCRCPVFGK